MAGHCTNLVLKVFKVLIFIHGFKFVCNHPLLTEDSNIIPPFHHSEEPFSLIPNEGWRSRSISSADSGSSSDIFNGENLSESDYRSKTENRENTEIELPDTSRRSHHRRRSAGDIGSLCSIFQTFLDARFAHCRVTNQQQEDRRQDDSSDDSNDLSLSREPNSRPIHGEEEMILGHHERPPPPPPQAPPNAANKRIDHDINSDEEDEQDETKISQDRTMIVVPDRPCPPGKRRDPRGYCRRVVTIRTNYGFGPPQGFRPIRYYYSRFVAVPTLHFILPNLK